MSMIFEYFRQKKVLRVKFFFVSRFFSSKIIKRETLKKKKKKKWSLSLSLSHSLASFVCL